MIRLDKYLADMGCGTRQEVKKFIRSGQVSVDGIVVKKPETKVEQTVQEVFLNGEKVGYESFEYYMLNKPAGVISATEDQSCQTVVDLIKDKKRKDLFPVGRLDKDTEGLLLITNDGALAHRLLSPKKHVDKCYFARICGKVTEEDVRSFEKGVNIGSQEQPEITMPGKLEIITSDDISKIRLTIQEGKFHQVKRMFTAIGSEVLFLKRITFGALPLDQSLKTGEYRALTKEEISILQRNQIKR